MVTNLAILNESELFLKIFFFLRNLLSIFSIVLFCICNTLLQNPRCLCRPQRVPAARGSQMDLRGGRQGLGEGQQIHRGPWWVFIGGG